MIWFLLYKILKSPNLTRVDSYGSNINFKLNFRLKRGEIYKLQELTQAMKRNMSNMLG